MQEKPIILQVIPTLNISGAEQGCFDVANYLTKNGFTSNIVTSSGYRIESVGKKWLGNCITGCQFILKIQ